MEWLYCNVRGVFYIIWLIFSVSDRGAVPHPHFKIYPPEHPISHLFHPLLLSPYFSLISATFHTTSTTQHLQHLQPLFAHIPHYRLYLRQNVVIANIIAYFIFLIFNYNCTDRFGLVYEIFNNQNTHFLFDILLNSYP